jgi:asparagine synthase (glutamine-hydrolysing)
MSGIAGIINLEGAPIDRELLRSMADFMSYRGPDAQTTWSAGSVGFGHALLCTTPEHRKERQPCTLDGQVWITADARVDGRDSLKQALGCRGRDGLADATDAELLLHTYHVWGEECVEHLLGDFAFAIWDGRQGRLFCARDHFGIKPFYYARLPDGLVFSNTLNCIRLHPAISDRLDDLAIGDFLLFGVSQEPSATCFADIRRLPPAHALTWSDGALRVRRYWSLPTGEEILYKRNGDYLEHFRDLLRTAVQDRLRTNRVAILMSGGMDSPALAATARELLKEQGGSFDLCAHTIVYDRLIPDQERDYAGLAARKLDIPIHYLAGDDYQFLRQLDRLVGCTPEPSGDLFAAVFTDLMRQVAAQGRVALTGYDGDAPLSMSLRAHYAGLLKAGRLMHLAADLGWYVWVQSKMRPFRFFERVKRRFGRSRQQDPGLPGWFNRAFAQRADLPTRWAQWNSCPSPVGPPARALAYRFLQQPGLQHLFEGYDPGVTRLPVEGRHPLMDLRLVRFLLALPPVPWCISKWLIRKAFRGVLPEAVCERRKSPLAGDPVYPEFQQSGLQLIRCLQPTQALRTYIDVPEWHRVAAAANTPDEYWRHLYPLCLNHWLLSFREVHDDAKTRY